MQKFISIEPMDPGTVHESTGLLQPDRAVPENEIFNAISSSSSSSSSTKEALTSLSPSGGAPLSKPSSSNSLSGGSDGAFFNSPVAQKSPHSSSGDRDPAVFSPFVINTEAPIVATQLQIDTSPISDVYNPPAAVSISSVSSSGANTSKARESRANKEPKSIRK